MAVDERELRQRLQDVAAHAGAPRFTVDGLVTRIRRRRARFIGAVSGTLAVVAAIAVAVSIGSGVRSRPPTAMPSTAPFRPSYTVAVNGQVQAASQRETPSRFAVGPGKNLKIKVHVTVPPHATVTTMWFGIARDGFGTSQAGPVGLRPILARIRAPLTAGVHTFRMEWKTPTGLRRGIKLHLVATWASGQSMVGQIIAELVLSR